MSILFNPFKFIAGARALIFGWAIMLITTLLASISNLHFDGAIDAHIGLKSPLIHYFLEQLIAWGTVSLSLYLAGMLLSKSRLRFVDFAGTAALSRAPMLLVGLISLFTASQGSSPEVLSPALLFTALIMIIPIIWMFALLYNGFTVSGNLKGFKAISGFIAAIFVAEIIAVYLIRYTLLKFLS